MNIFKLFRDKKYRNAEMVSYWKHGDMVEAKLTKGPDGSYMMQMLGEKYPFQGFPRGTLLFGSLSPLKHQIKNKIFNDAWARLENGDNEALVASEFKEKVWPNIFAIGEACKYDMVPPERLCPAVKELHRALTVVGDENIHKWRDILCFIFQEDDAYRFRLQWIAKFFSRWHKPTRKEFEYALKMMEEAELVGDMKERQRLLRRILLVITKDSKIFDAFLKEVDWEKIRLTKADKYFFRAKYFKVDYPEYQY